mmetsp:Transcript_40246/g.46307  ORF Transcript_40246/g.46307 Transcript_40246/m.46307 type:complete len:140 (+) Transcript_40246:604-1023(+)
MAFGFPRSATATATTAGASSSSSLLLSEDDDEDNDDVRQQHRKEKNNHNHNNTIPLGYGPPLIWDQASAAMARGEIQLCHRDGHPLPKGVAIDKKGAPTTPPHSGIGRSTITLRWSQGFGDHHDDGITGGRIDRFPSLL